MVSQTRREFLKLGLAAAASAAAASGIEIPLLGNQNSNLQNQLNSANTQMANLKTKLNTVTGFVSLSINEQSLVEAIVRQSYLRTVQVPVMRRLGSVTL